MPLAKILQSPVIGLVKMFTRVPPPDMGSYAMLVSGWVAGVSGRLTPCHAPCSRGAAVFTWQARPLISEAAVVEPCSPMASHIGLMC